jgi:lactoylglutathione lyase
VTTSPGRPPLSFEVALTTADVPALYARAVKAGAMPVSEPATKPWGQTVAYVRDKDGHLVELCTPMP